MEENSSISNTLNTLNNLNNQKKKQITLAVIGPFQSGKTTLAGKLLQRYQQRF